MLLSQLYPPESACSRCGLTTQSLSRTLTTLSQNTLDFSSCRLYRFTSKCRPTSSLQAQDSITCLNGQLVKSTGHCPPSSPSCPSQSTSSLQRLTNAARSLLQIDHPSVSPFVVFCSPLATQIKSQLYAISTVYFITAGRAADFMARISFRADRGRRTVVVLAAVMVN